MSASEPERRPASKTLLTRIVVTNTAVVAVAVILLLISPATVSSPPAFTEIVLVVGGVVAIVVIDLFLITRALAPLKQLGEAMQEVEVLRPSGPLEVRGGSAEVENLSNSFDAMLASLQEERRASVLRSLAAQEAERLRIARELHDEVGQRLTGVVLQLDSARRGAEGPVREVVAEAQEEARGALEEVREIAKRLRPEALEDLGLRSAMATLVQRFSARTGLEPALEIDPDLPPVESPIDLVVYRIAQEGLTNVARHADARHVRVALEAREGGLRMLVEDDGRGLTGAPAGAGMQGMRERALMVGGSLRVGAGEAGGTRLELWAPLAEAPG
jgi:two-component system, NarL family, sensor histidine kinase UhpB